MDKKDIPTITYRGREITPAPVKMKVWRMMLNEPDLGEDMTVRMDYYLRMIVETFGIDEITLEVLDDILPVADVIPLYHQCVKYVFGLSVSKLDKLPKNADAPTTAQN